MSETFKKTEQELTQDQKEFVERVQLKSGRVQDILAGCTIGEAFAILDNVKAVLQGKLNVKLSAMTVEGINA